MNRRTVSLNFEKLEQSLMDQQALLSPSLEPYFVSADKAIDTQDFDEIKDELS